MPRPKKTVDMPDFIANSERTHKNTHSYLEHYLTSIKNRYSYQQLKLDGLRNRINPGFRPFGAASSPLSIEWLTDNAEKVIALAKVKTGFSKIPRWNDGIDLKVKLMLAHAILIRHGLYIPYSLHLSENVSKDILANPGGEQKYFAQRIRDVFRRHAAFKGFIPQFYWRIERSEERSSRTGKKLLHVHGAISVRSFHENDITAVESAMLKIGGSDYVSGKKGDQFYISPVNVYLPGHKKAKQGEMGGASYFTKNLRQRKQGIGIRAAGMTPGLRNAAKALYAAYRQEMMTAKPDGELSDAINALFEWSLHNLRQAKVLGLVIRRAAAFGICKSAVTFVNSDIEFQRANKYIPDDVELFHSLVGLLKLEGLELVRAAVNDNKAEFKHGVFKCIDAKRSLSGGARLRSWIKHNDEQTKRLRRA